MNGKLMLGFEEKILFCRYIKEFWTHVLYMCLMYGWRRWLCGKVGGHYPD